MRKRWLVLAAIAAVLVGIGAYVSFKEPDGQPPVAVWVRPGEVARLGSAPFPMQRVDVRIAPAGRTFDRWDGTWSRTLKDGKRYLSIQRELSLAQKFRLRFGGWVLQPAIGGYVDSGETQSVGGETWALWKWVDWNGLQRFLNENWVEPPPIAPR